MTCCPASRITRRAFVRALAACALTASSPLLAACASSPTPAANGRTTPAVTGKRYTNSAGVALPDDAAPPDRQVLTIPEIEGKHLHKPSNSYEGFASNGVYEPLAWIDADAKPHPAGADSWETSADGLTWTFHLRKSARWSDGTPVTADDWVYSFRRMVDPQVANPYSWLIYPLVNADAINTGKLRDLSQLGVRKIDDYTVAFTTEQVTPYMLLCLCYQPAIAPKHMVEKHGEAWAYSVETAVSNGPFMYGEWNKGRNLILKPNPHYAGPQQAKLEKVVLTFIPQSNAPRLQMFKANEIDSIDLLDSTVDVSNALNDPEIARDLETYAAFVTFYMFFNTVKPPFDNLKVRQAFSHAIDRTALTQQVMQKLARPAFSMLPDGLMCSQNGSPAIQSVQAHDPELARKLLAEAGYAGGQGFPAVELWTRQGQYAREAEAVQGMLRSTLGVQVQPRDIERTLFMDKLAKHEITLGILQWKMDFEDPSNLLDWWGAQTRHTWKNETYNRLITEARSILDQTARCKAYNDAERILIEDVGGVFLGYPVWAALHKPWVGGIRRRRDGVRAQYKFLITDAYIKQH